MNCIITIDDLSLIRSAAAEDPFAIEIRLDLMTSCTPDDLTIVRKQWDGPLLLTLRSHAEGGAFMGGPGEWKERLAPLLPYADMVDIEEQFSLHADWARSGWIGSGWIGSPAATEVEPRPETRPETKIETKPETKPETTPETKAEAKPETKPETTPESTQETKPETTIETKPKTIIASYHAEKMLTPDEFTACEHRLRSFGDIPKIVLAPQNNEDAITLLSCLVHAEKPICVSIMGTGYSWLRPFLLLMGSHFAYCHSGAGEAPAAGQFHIQEMKQVLSLLSHNR